MNKDEAHELVLDTTMGLPFDLKRFADLKAGDWFIVLGGFEATPTPEDPEHSTVNLTLVSTTRIWAKGPHDDNMAYRLSLTNDTNEFFGSYRAEPASAEQIPDDAFVIQLLRHR